METRMPIQIIQSYNQKGKYCLIVRTCDNDRKNKRLNDLIDNLQNIRST